MSNSILLHSNFYYTVYFSLIQERGGVTMFSTVHSDQPSGYALFFKSAASFLRHKIRVHRWYLKMRLWKWRLWLGMEILCAEDVCMQMNPASMLERKEKKRTISKHKVIQRAHTQLTVQSHRRTWTLSDYKLEPQVVRQNTAHQS